jgi:hypothetical protein
MDSQNTFKTKPTILQSKPTSSPLSSSKVPFLEDNLSVSSSRNLGLDVILLIVGGILTFILSLCGFYNFAMQNEIIKNDPIPEALNR